MEYTSSTNLGLEILSASQLQTAAVQAICSIKSVPCSPQTRLPRARPRPDRHRRRRSAAPGPPPQRKVPRPARASPSGRQEIRRWNCERSFFFLLVLFGTFSAGGRRGLGGLRPEIIGREIQAHRERRLDNRVGGDARADVLGRGFARRSGLLGVDAAAATAAGRACGSRGGLVARERRGEP